MQSIGRLNSCHIDSAPTSTAQFVQLALDNGWHHFSEAHLWTPNYQNVQSISAEKGLISAASSSLLFLPAVKELKRIVSEELGEVALLSNGTQHLHARRHTGEEGNYYARKRGTSAGREMWGTFRTGMLSYAFGIPKSVSGVVCRRGRLELDSEDSWCLQMVLKNGAVGVLSVLMASLGECRRGSGVGDNGIVEFDIFSGVVRRELPAIGISDMRNWVVRRS